MPEPHGDQAADSGEKRTVARPSRRALLAGGLVTAGAAAGAGGMALARPQPAAAQLTGNGETVDLAKRYPFYASKAGAPQAGIATLPQRYCVYLTLDVTAAVATELQVLLARWSAAIAQLHAGKTIGAVAPPNGAGTGTDTGEAVGLGPASLTVTVGLGPGIFDDRFGLSAKRPARLAPIPALPSDRLQPTLTGGDLSLQACADDPQVAYHAVRDLVRLARGSAVPRWTVIGFGRASAGPDQSTPRNLMGFKDGTRNIETSADYQRWVWASADQRWMAGGSYQVARKIQMNIETWDADVVNDQETVFGRTKPEGAPLSGGSEFTTPDFSASHGGETLIDSRAHIALAAPENNSGVKIRRRSYNYTDGLNQYGLLDAGLLFIAYMNDPAHFAQLQGKLGASDRLNEYISHVGSAVFAIPPAPRPGSYIGQALFQ